MDMGLNQVFSTASSKASTNDNMTNSSNSDNEDQEVAIPALTKTIKSAIVPSRVHNNNVPFLTK